MRGYGVGGQSAPPWGVSPLNEQVTQAYQNVPLQGTQSHAVLGAPIVPAMCQHALFWKTPVALKE